MPKNNRKVITIDGLAGTGKTSLAKRLAERLQFQHLNTGILYRAIAFLLLDRFSTDQKKPVEQSILNEEGLAALLSSVTITVEQNKHREPIVRISGYEPQSYDDLQSEWISQLASQVASFQVVRDYLLPIQQQAFSGVDIVAEGRDMGTVVFPDATFKVYVEVAAETRAERRYHQLLHSELIASQTNLEQAKNQIKFDILERDLRDQQRALAPCIPAPDAVIFKNEAISLTDAVNELYTLASCSLTA